MGETMGGVRRNNEALGQREWERGQEQNQETKLGELVSCIYVICFQVNQSFGLKQTYVY